MEESAPVPNPERVKVIEIAARRGYNRVAAIALTAAGLVPAAALVIIRPPTMADAPLIGALLVIVPAVVLLLWAMRDREGQAAREMVMWARTVSKAEVALPEDVEAAFQDLIERPTYFEVPTRDVRETLTPMVAAPGLLGLRIAIYRYWYPIVWTLSSLVLVLVFYIATSLTPAA